jgi:hypothetical protein
LGPQEDKFNELYQTFNRYNKEKQQKQLPKHNHNSEESVFSFTGQEQSKINYKKENTKGTNLIVFINRFVR